MPRRAPSLVCRVGRVLDAADQVLHIGPTDKGIIDVLKAQGPFQEYGGNAALKTELGL